jgi:hypothetical protein
LRGAAAELLDVEGGHRAYGAHSKKKTYREFAQIAEDTGTRSKRTLSGSNARFVNIGELG